MTEQRAKDIAAKQREFLKLTGEFGDTYLPNLFSELQAREQELRNELGPDHAAPGKLADLRERLGHRITAMQSTRAHLADLGDAYEKLLVQADEHVALERQVFEQEGHLLVYDYNLLKAVQTRTAAELHDHKLQALKNPQPKADLLLQSGATDYYFLSAAYLLRRAECDDAGTLHILPFKRDDVPLVQRLAEQFCQEDDVRLGECMHDFFTRRGEQRIVSGVLLRDENVNWLDMIRGMIRTDGSVPLMQNTANAGAVNE